MYHLYHCIVGAKSKETKHYVIYFPEELKYSFLEGKLIEEINPRIKHPVHVKDADGSWEGVVYALGMCNLEPKKIKQGKMWQYIFQTCGSRKCPSIPPQGRSLKISWEKDS